MSTSCSISADGRYVAFYSMASNLVPGDTNGTTIAGFDIFVYDRQTDMTQRVSVAADGTQGNGNSMGPSISADGRFVKTFANGSSHAADVAFALAVGNTNPQGIADPPAPRSELVPASLAVGDR